MSYLYRSPAEASTTSGGADAEHAPAWAVSLLPGSIVPNPPPNGRDHAELFVEAIHGDVDADLSFQTFLDHGNGRALTDFGKLRAFRAALDHHNSQGHGVFAVVNQTDPADDAGLTKRSVVAPTAWFTDADVSGRRRVRLHARPTLIDLSKGGPHVLWRCHGSTTLEEWVEGQWILAWHYRTDPAMKNVDRVLRLPGFNHRKDPTQPFLVEIVHIDQTAEISFDDVLSIRGPLSDAEKKAYSRWNAYDQAARKHGGPTPDHQDDDWAMMAEEAAVWMRAVAAATRGKLRRSKRKPSVLPFEAGKGGEHWRSYIDWWVVLAAMLEHGSTMKLPRFGTSDWHELRPKAIAWMRRWKAYKKCAALEGSHEQ